VNSSVIYAEEPASVPDRLLRLAPALLHLRLQRPPDLARCTVEDGSLSRAVVFCSRLTVGVPTPSAVEARKLF
jgi:hypothetical protein